MTAMLIRARLLVLLRMVLSNCAVDAVSVYTPQWSGGEGCRTGKCLFSLTTAFPNLRMSKARSSSSQRKPGPPGDPHSFHNFSQFQIPYATLCGNGNPI
jgi:hypothetical protein